MRRYPFIALLLFVFSTSTFAGAPADPFTVTGIAVQATAASSVEAQNIAINSGKQKAWTQVYQKLTTQADWPKQPVLDDMALTRLIASYVPSNERRSTTRYSATMTYIFNAGAVRHLLHAQNIAYADQAAKPVLVIPMGPTFQPHSVWGTVWLNPKYAHGAVPVLLPPAGADAALGALTFADADWKTVGPIAAQVKADDAYLALASAQNGHVIVKLKRLGLGTSPPIPDVDVPVPANMPAANIYAAVADNTAVAIVNAWKGHAAVDYGRRSKLTADIHIDSLEQWGAMLQKLTTVPNVTDVSVVAIDIGEARVAITYVGNLDQFHDNMTKGGFTLTNDESGWTIAQTQTAPAGTDTDTSQQ
jgi:hypothetical protein